MKFVDLSSGEPKKVEVLTISEVAGQIQISGVNSYALRNLFANWLDDDEMSTPEPSFTLDNIPYWKPEQVKEWEELYGKGIEQEEARKAKLLETQTLSKKQIIDQLIERAKWVEKQNARCYSHNRSNTMSDGRKRVLELKGAIDFVYLILEQTTMTEELRIELNDLLHKSKAHVKMQ